MSDSGNTLAKISLGGFALNSGFSDSLASSEEGAG